MKSITTIALLSIVALSSCKKDWRCVCTTNTGNTQNVHTYEETTKKIAKDRCEAENKSYQSGSQTITETCELD